MFYMYFEPGNAKFLSSLFNIAKNKSIQDLVMCFFRFAKFIGQTLMIKWYEALRG